MEIFADHTNVTSNINEIDTDEDDANEGLKSSSDYRYGIRVLPTYNLTPDAEIHAIIGYVRGKFELKLIDSINGGASSSFQSSGYQLGFGSSINLTTNIAIRTDVIYSHFSSQTRFTAKNEPSSLDGMLSLVYSLDKLRKIYK